MASVGSKENSKEEDAETANQYPFDQLLLLLGGVRPHGGPAAAWRLLRAPPPGVTQVWLRAGADVSRPALNGM